MPLTPEERAELMEELRREQAEASKTPEEKEEDAFLDKLADKLHSRLTAKPKDKAGEGEKPDPEQKPKGGHPMEKRLFGRK